MKPNNKLFFTLLTVVLLLSVGANISVHAQGCPSVRVSSGDTVNAGEPISFTANVNGGDRNVTPTYNWTVSAGMISSGQGTSSITVDTAGLSNTSVTATVDVGGFPRECSTSNSSTTLVMEKTAAAAAAARKFDEYGKLKPEDEQMRLDNFVVEMQNDPTVQGYIISYGGRRSKAGEAQKTAVASKAYLIKKRGLASSRLVTIDGGYREEPATELWLAPSGATPPMASPTVDPSEVQSAKKSKKPAKAKTKTGKKS